MSFATTNFELVEELTQAVNVKVSTFRHSPLEHHLYSKCTLFFS